MSQTTILVADDHELVRRGLVSILARHPEWKVVAEVANGSDAIKEGELLQPNVAILDLSMPGKNGLDVAQGLRKWSLESAFLS
jgi:DNA-binding NarL/FixJ family response regulator